jgi:uncharacterized protein
MSSANPVTQDEIDGFVGACHGDFATVERMLSQHASLATSPATWGETPIQAAAQMARLDIAGLLLQAGAPLDICTAAVFGMADKVHEMLAADRSLSQTTGAHGFPLLYYPAVAGRTDIALMALEHGADINAGEGSVTPLHGAAMFGRVDSVRWLVEHGADTRAQNYEGKTPLQVAEESGHGDVAEILRSAGAGGQ